MEILEDDIEELKIDNLVGEQGELSYTGKPKKKDPALCVHIREDYSGSGRHSSQHKA